MRERLIAGPLAWLAQLAYLATCVLAGLVLVAIPILAVWGAAQVLVALTPLSEGEAMLATLIGPFFLALCFSLGRSLIDDTIAYRWE